MIKCLISLYAPKVPVEPPPHKWMPIDVAVLGILMKLIFEPSGPSGGTGPLAARQTPS